MIQLKVYKTERVVTGTTADANALFLDLYETEPIKLTLSIEDITNADATSVFSKTFRVPATRHNNEFFENVYEIDGIDFDVTVKNPAQILVDGAEFREGHIRLQKIFRNHDLDRVDYELLFLGETRDFSSAVGESSLCQMTMTDFSWPNLPVAYTNADDFTGSATYTEITNSWLAFPQSASTTAGHADGDILYPLIDHGNQYNEQTGAIASGFGAISIGQSESFTSNSNAIATSRLKPMIRAKRVWDQIFQDAGYTYQSDFLDSDRFKQMYASAFGNRERASIDQDQVTTGLFEVFGTGANGDNGLDRFCYFNNIVQNSPDFIQGTPDTGSGGGSSFIAQDTADPSGAYFNFEAGARVGATAYEPNDPNGYEDIYSRIRLLCISATTGITHVIATGNWETLNLWTFLNYDSRNGGYQPEVNDTFKVDIQSQNSFDNSQVGIVYWKCISAPGSYYMPRDLDCEYLQIDYIKDIVTMFRLVMQPDNKRPNHFIIEPWSEFIGSGTTYDWSDKLVEDKDMVLEPLFNTQSAQIEYTFTEDEDLINKFHQDNNKHAYGWLRFDSQNELLKGTRKVEVKGIAPTPIDQINHGSNGNHPFPQFILPSIVEISGENFQRLPIKPKTRFLFYNGLQDITVSQDNWYLIDGNSPSAEQPYWPLVSPYENWPIVNLAGPPAVNTLNLNFSNDTRYYINPDPNYYDNQVPPQVIQPGYFDQGLTLFDSYWSRYVSSLYDKFSRRLTAKFILNNVDLQYLTFDDVIFVNGKYYRPEKIINAQVGAETEVTCQLITLNDQRPIWLDEPLTGFSVVASNTSCIGQQGEIQITTDGTPAFTWELDASGAQGTVNPTGSAPFTFTITAPVGIDTLIVTDALGRVATVQVDVPASTASPVTSSFTTVDPTICTESSVQTTTIVDYESTTPYVTGTFGAFAHFDTKLIDLLESQVARPLPVNGTGTGFNAFGLDYNFRLDTTTYPNLLTEWSGVITWTNLSFTTTNWSQYALGYSGPDGITPQIVPAQYVSGWPTSLPPIGTSFTVNVNNLPVQFGTQSSPSPTMDFFAAKNGSNTSGWSGKWENTGRIIGKQLTIATQCNGEIDTTPAGGAGAPYTTTWSDAYGTEDRVNLCPGTYQYYVEDSAGCQSDIYTVTLDCATVTYNYVLREYLNNCTQISAATYIASSSSQLPIGQVCILQQRQGCYYIESVTQNNAQYSISGINVDCAACDGGAVPLSYEVETCDTGANTYYVTRTGPSLTPGQAVELNNQTGCFIVIGDSTIAPGSDATTVYQDCAACNSATTFGYYAFACDTVSFPPTYFQSTTQLTVGGVYKISTGTYTGTCVQIISLQQTPSGEFLNPTPYTDCDDCQGIAPPVEQVCHTLTNSGLSTASGTYFFNGLGYSWIVNGGNQIAICAEVGSITTNVGAVTILISDNPCTSPKQCTLPPPAPDTYVIESCIASMGNWTLERGTSSFSLGDVVQFRLTTGLAVYCGTIITLNNGTPDAILHNEISSYGCEDSIHCLQ